MKMAKKKGKQCARTRTLLYTHTHTFNHPNTNAHALHGVIPTIIRLMHTHGALVGLDITYHSIVNRCVKFYGW